MFFDVFMFFQLSHFNYQKWKDQRFWGLTWTLILYNPVKRLWERAWWDEKHDQTRICGPFKKVDIDISICLYSFSRGKNLNLISKKIVFISSGRAVGFPEGRQCTEVSQGCGRKKNLCSLFTAFFFAALSLITFQ